ncbi:SDR family oxidoreductase [Lacinutrix sp. C3R15]|uniref:SDR family oxidoreductase n=1 Tax=Flavobacteriaceae TaxID=49546 RepID=UPI001C0A254F|nr:MULTISPECIES: SDR family oxidoreductase [Flavobacteriaceae]MBU2940134.1 SDR family oxidoreductase [Lacinutrix sp. C3R15]MDO6623451.1 SDR family oxidoreductase [Oceanihabitans sp. 1_MG-2023]
MGVLNQFQLKGKVALVTGCKRGIGKAMAIALAEAGADIIGVSSSLEKSGSTIEKAVQKLGRKFTAYTCNFSNTKALYTFIEEVKKDFPVIDILVNNAGTIQRAPATEHNDEIWDEVIAVNQTAPFILTREIGKDMVSRGAGKIVFTASLLSFQGGITVPSYAASKGAIGQITKAFANEWAKSGVHVNAIAPGYISTDNTKALQKDSTRSQAILSRIPAERWGNPEDFAGPIVFLCSNASNYMHGSILLVDGGWMAR